MAVTLTVENINAGSYSFPLQETQSTFGKSYYKFYQLKLRQLLTENRHRQEQRIKVSKQKQSKNQLNEKRVLEERMNDVREKMKLQSRECLIDKNDDNGKRSSSVLSGGNRRTKDVVTFTVTTTNISTTTATTTTSTGSKPKSILKTKQSSSSTKRQRVISAPANSQRHVNKRTPIKMPTIEIDYTDDQLSNSNGHSFTQVSSSSQNHIHRNHQYARQSILNTIMLHLNSHAPSDVSKWNTYREFDDKFSASISSRVYQDFERIIL